ncbi:MAG: ergothioneine biosynthesis protein EgtB, partial [Myxococcota bacterium]
MTTHDSVGGALAARYVQIRDFSLELCAPLSSEDCAIQTMPDVSPTRWHLAHTTWFFETIILAERPGHKPFDPNFDYLFNSYYNAIGDQYPRHERGLLSRPSLDEVLAYRRYVDECMAQVFESEQALAEAAGRIEVGLNHEQQHQELILTDIKHVLAQNPLRPVYREGTFRKSVPPPIDRWMPYPEGTYWVGHTGEGFGFDNESPRHREFLEAFELNCNLVSCGDYIRFIEDGGYRRPDLWLSLGWEAVREQGLSAPLYWHRDGSDFTQYTLAGQRKVDPALPVCHVSYFEADAFARWAHARL